MRFDEGGRELGPAVGTVPGGVFGGEVFVGGSVGEKGGHFADFVGVLLLEGGDVFLGVSDGFDGFGYGVDAQELDVLLAAEEEFEAGLEIDGEGLAECGMRVDWENGVVCVVLPVTFEAPSCCRCTRPTPRRRCRSQETRGSCSLSGMFPRLPSRASGARLLGPGLKCCIRAVACSRPAVDPAVSWTRPRI